MSCTYVKDITGSQQKVLIVTIPEYDSERIPYVPQPRGNEKCLCGL